MFQNGLLLPMSPGRGTNYFIGMLTSRMAIYAYGIGSSFTTALYVLGIYFDVVVVQTRLDERLPLILEMYIRVLVPLWIPPIRSIDILTFIVNVFFALNVLLYWTSRYVSAIGYGGRRFRRRW